MGSSLACCSYPRGMSTQRIRKIVVTANPKGIRHQRDWERTHANAKGIGKETPKGFIGITMVGSTSRHALYRLTRSSLTCCIPLTTDTMEGGISPFGDVHIQRTPPRNNPRNDAPHPDKKRSSVSQSPADADEAVTRHDKKR